MGSLDRTGYTFLSGLILGRIKRIGLRLLTRTFRLLQVVHPLEVPGIPTMFWSARLTSHSIVDTKSTLGDFSVDLPEGPTLELCNKDA